MSIKVISFDFDGTIRPDIADGMLTFNVRKRVMLDYLKRESISTKKMYEIYESLPKNKQEELGLIGNNLITQNSSIPDDVVNTLKELSKRYKLIIISVSKTDRIVDILKKYNINDLFSKIYSVKEDFNESLKSAFIFQNIAKELQVSPDECLHIGDLYEADYLAPKEAGFHILLVDHSPIKKIEFVDIPKYLKDL